MKKMRDNQPLLEALLEPEGADAQREALLRQTLGTARRHRRVRRAGSLAAMAVIFVALALAYRYFPLPSGAPELAANHSTQRATPTAQIAAAPSIAPTPSATPATSVPLALTRALPAEMRATTRPGCTALASTPATSIPLVATRTDLYTVIDDAQLLAQFSDQGAILIPRHNGQPARFMLASQPSHAE